MKRRALYLIPAAVAALLFSFLVAASPAAATTDCLWVIYQGNDAGFVMDDCYTLEVHDVEADGHGVCIEFYTNQDYTKRRVCDPDGSPRMTVSGPVGQRPGVWHDGQHRMTNYRVCESTVGCSGWWADE